MSPYVVTTKRREHERPVEFVSREVVSRRAVATLDEARASMLSEHVGRITLAQTLAISESGGTVGPLPDGTMVEVEATSYGHLTLATPVDLRPRPDANGRISARPILAAFNAAQAVSR